MNTWTWRYKAVVAAGVFIAFVTVYMVNWQATYGFNDNILVAFKRGWNAFFLFHWVASYQTLLGGLLAFGAGTFVYLAARFQTEVQRQEKFSSRIREATQTLGDTEIAFADIRHAFTWKHIDVGLDACRKLETLVPGLVNMDRHFATIVSQSAKVARLGLEALKQPNDPQSPQRVRLGYGHAVALNEYISRNHVTLDHEGNVTGARASRDTIAPILQKHSGAKFDELYWAALLFD